MNSNILFIDDEKDILKAYRCILKQDSSKSDIDDLLAELDDDSIVNTCNNSIEDKYTFFEASQGQEGVDIVKFQKELGQPISVCFVDFRMPPGINGKDTIKAIREYDKNVEIVLVTAYSDIDLEEIVKEVGTPEKLLFLKKPFDNKEVKQLMLNLSHKYFDARVRENFVSNVTHELKTPLASILGFTQLLLEDELSEEHKDFVETILSSSLIMKEQVDDLLSVASIDKKRNNLNKENITASEIVKNVSTIMLPLFEETELEFIVEKEDDFVFFADSNKIKQCLINLLTNSKKFTEEGFVKIKFFIADGVGHFEISDSGIGMPKEKLGRVFDKFFRIEDTHHSIPGLGLGLSIVKNIIDAHCMDINVKSELGAGTVFSISVKDIKTQGDNI